MDLKPEQLPLYPVAVAAKESGISLRTLYRWLSQGKIKYFYLPGDTKKPRKLVMLSHVTGYLKQLKKQVPTPPN